MIPWNRQTREEKALEIAWMLWLGTVFLTGPIVWLLSEVNQ